MEFASLDEAKLLNIVTWVMILGSVVTFMVLKDKEAPYGRYMNDSGVLIPSNIAWLVQESPSIIVPAVLIVFTDSPKLSNTANVVLVTLFCIHYTQRTLVYPFLIRGGKPTPLRIFIGVIVFCLCNGYLQSRTLTAYAIYPAYWTRDIRFIIGGMFNYVSGANFLGDIIEWTGFAIACWNLQATIFALFTLANIGPRAMSHHRCTCRNFLTATLNPGKG